MKEKLAHMIAAALHEDWRKTRLNPDGTFNPRWKKIKDEKFIEGLDKDNLPASIRIENGVFEIDIANSSYDELSEDWKAENKAAAEVVAEIICSEKEYTLDEIGSIIHDEWLKRNDWAKGGELDVPFSELSTEEQNKDLAQYRVGLDIALKMKEKTGEMTL